MPLLVGVAACEALREDFGVRAWLKHPNDLLAVQAATWRKVGGLLVDGAVQGETLRHAIVSLGVNCASPPGGFARDLESTATSLESLGAPASPSDLADAFLRRLASWRRAMDERPQSWAEDLPGRHAALLRRVIPGEAAAADGSDDAAPSRGAG
jgi:biotin-(acetyl-CoA carboxylase) ligase